ncbi:MAG: hypothetical protein Q4G60_06125 [bacterium]|nr:hypothetical protein [bacterium]
MGQGSYTASDWNRLKNSRGLSADANANQTFANDTVQDKYNARFIAARESFDSEDSPKSTPIIIGFDVTGSMGYLANEIATNSLNETIMQILTKKPVTNPHMMCAAFTDPGDPLQITQFEADIRVVEQLLDFKLGGGNTRAFDNILWYFAAKHTKIDSFTKRGKKGILIGIGDEICDRSENQISAAQLETLFSDKEMRGVSFDEALSMAQEQYEVVHIVVGEEARFANGPDVRYGASYHGWKEALPGRVVKLRAKNIGLLADVIVACIQLLNGVSRQDALEQIPIEKQEIVRTAIEDFWELGYTPTEEKTSGIFNSSLANEITKKRGIFDGLFRNRK